MTTPHPRRGWRMAALIAGALLSLYVLLWGYRLTQSRLSVFTPLALAVAGVAVLLIGAVWLWNRYGALIMGYATRAVRWGWKRIQQAPWYRAAHVKYPTLWRVAERRLDPHAATGLGLSVMVLIGVGILWAFVEILFEVVSGTSVTVVDHRVINLFQALRTSAVDEFMLAVTYIGSGRSVALLSATAVVVTLLLRRRHDAVAIVASLLAGSAFFTAIKLIIQRPRPPLYDARIVQSGFSFPSGHATMAAVFYATLAVVLMRAVRAVWLRIIIALTATAMVLLIGLSRIYLGVHYPSDVLAGWLGGVLWALLVLAVLHVWRAPWLTPPAHPTIAAERVAVGRTRLSVAVALSLVTIVAIWRTRPPIPAPPTMHVSAPMRIDVAQLPTFLETRGPRYTMGLFGHRQEPVNLIFIGTRSQIIQTFGQAGWVSAAPLSWHSLRHAVAATVTGTSDASGPVTPSFLRDLPEALAFNQPVGRTFARRHHIRIWPAPYATANGVPIWLATASYDEGFAVARWSLLPVHQIAPAIDDERDYVVANLVRTGFATTIGQFRIVPPQMGTNAFGEPFFTYGGTVEMQLRSQ